MITPAADYHHRQQLIIIFNLVCVVSSDQKTQFPTLEFK